MMENVKKKVLGQLNVSKSNTKGTVFEAPLHFAPY